ncbi:MAG: cation:proton antiporter, partial [Gemmatimonadales bacterium]
RHSILLGCILGGSSSIIIMPAMTLARVRGAIANLVNLESAFTDAFCVVGAAAMIDLILRAAAGDTGGASPGAALARSFGVGTGIGLVSGFAWLLFLRLLKVSEHAYPITLSALLLLYVAIDQSGGSAALGILAFAVVVGNATMIWAKLGFSETLDLGTDVRGFHRQVTFIVKSFFFTFMGAMLGPPWPMVLLGVLLGFVLLAARIPGVWLALVGSKLSSAERRLVLVSMPRGMAAGVLATMPAAAGIVGTDDLPNAVFAAALVSILIFAVGFPQARKGMEAAVPAGGGEPPFPPPVAEPPAAALVPAAGPAPEEPAPAPPVAVEPAPPGDPVPPPAESSPVEPERGPVPPEGPPPAPWS